MNNIKVPFESSKVEMAKLAANDMGSFRASGL